MADLPTTETIRGRHNANASLEGMTYRQAEAQFNAWLDAHTEETSRIAATAAALGSMERAWDSAIAHIAPHLDPATRRAAYAENPVRIMQARQMLKDTP